MLRIDGIKLPYSHSEEELWQAAAKRLGCEREEITSLTLLRRSLDARERPVKAVYSLAVTCEREKKYLLRNRRGVTSFREEQYAFQPTGTRELATPPVVIGAGPAGLFCSYFLAKAGYRPLLLERGEPVEERTARVNAFWAGKEPLHPDSNVQFGEGGAGTFSDGKLNSQVKDPRHRGREVLRVFAQHGAPEEIIYQAKPHIGTDRLKTVIRALREDLLSMGAKVEFRAKVVDLWEENDALAGVILEDGRRIKTSVAVLAPGHSARDTFRLLREKKIAMEPKPFAVGVRIEHPQAMISAQQYKDAWQELEAADYKLTHQAKNGRGVYSFCMCPGGEVVNASSEPGFLAVNGMSNYARDGVNANSAIVVAVKPEDFCWDESAPQKEDPLIGVSFQRKLECAAYLAGDGLVPVQLFGDFCEGVPSTHLGNVLPQIRGGYRLCNLRDCLPAWLSATIQEGILAFDRQIPGFARLDAVLSGVESRTSSPVRICRNEQLESSLPGLYPCGEGAGYAGGILSAAMDGIRVYEAIASKYSPAGR